MVDLDFCKLEVTIIHSLQTFSSMVDKFHNVKEITKYFDLYNSSSTDLLTYFRDDMRLGNDADLVIKLQFDNTQLNCELKIIDSTEDASDNFVFKVWNLPNNTVLFSGDYLLFKFYWESDPEHYTSYHGVIKDIKAKRSSADLLITAKGEVVNQNILYNWSIYEKYPKLHFYSDVKDFIENELNFNFVPMVTGFNNDTVLPTPIFTRGKSVGIILEEVCKQITDSVSKDDPCHWKFINGQTILLYKDSDLGGRILNEYFKIAVPSIKYNDLLEYTPNDTGYIVNTFGIPALVSGIVFHINADEVPSYLEAESAYYTANEIEHNITLSSGYIMKIYATKTQ